MAQLAEGFGFNLANAFAGDAELAAHFLQSAGTAVPEAEALFNNFAFTVREGVQNILDFFFQERERIRRKRG